MSKMKLIFIVAKFVFLNLLCKYLHLIVDKMLTTLSSANKTLNLETVKNVIIFAINTFKLIHTFCTKRRNVFEIRVGPNNSNYLVFE